jgi:hypothetical protein
MFSDTLRYFCFRDSKGTKQEIKMDECYYFKAQPQFSFSEQNRHGSVKFPQMNSPFV